MSNGMSNNGVHGNGHNGHLHARGAAIVQRIPRIGGDESAVPNGTDDSAQRKRTIRRKKQVRSSSSLLGWDWNGGRPLLQFSKTSRSLAAIATLFVLTTCGIYLIVSEVRQIASRSSGSSGSTQRRRTEHDAAPAKFDRWKHVEELWKKRNAKEFEGVAPHAPKRKDTNEEPNQDNMPLVQRLQDDFDRMRRKAEQDATLANANAPGLRRLLLTWLDQENVDVSQNIKLSTPRWIRPYLLPPLPQFRPPTDTDKSRDRRLRQHKPLLSMEERSNFFRTYRKRDSSDMVWHQAYEQLLHEHERHESIPGPVFDYTDHAHYTYPAQLSHPPVDGSYPQLFDLDTLMEEWPQDDDFPATHARPQIRETLQHFNYSDPAQLQMATLFRDAELPFKLYGVPDVDAASHKWTDEYVSSMFGAHSGAALGGAVDYENEKIPLAKGTAQESRTNYFAFFVAKAWDLEHQGLAPTRNNDWSYDTWSRHAVYADAVSLSAQQPHFYWQSGVPPEERHLPRHKWCFISRDLPSLSSAQENFFVFHVQEQKGIQCRFGERGVVAATHFDGGRNMVAMVQGAKRYILSPPNQCSKLGIFTEKRSPIYRHSLLNFGHIPYLRNSSVTGMSTDERAWLERAASSQALETVLKKGEVLYIPSHWFHYIVSLQKSAQCNVRSGIDQEGTVQFGGRDDVETCLD